MKKLFLPCLLGILAVGTFGVTLSAQDKLIPVNEAGYPKLVAANKGKVVLVNFWATWCAPCKIEMPWFVELQKQYGPDGFQIVGVAMDDASTKDIADFAHEMGVNYPVLIGKESVGDAYGGVQFLPENFYIDRNGKVVDRAFGLKGRGEIEDEIKKIIASTAVAQK